jgi:hypothetical protein
LVGHEGPTALPPWCWLATRRSARRLPAAAPSSAWARRTLSSRFSTSALATNISASVTASASALTTWSRVSGGVDRDELAVLVTPGPGRCTRGTNPAPASARALTAGSPHHVPTRVNFPYPGFPDRVRLGVSLRQEHVGGAGPAPAGLERLRMRLRSLTTSIASPEAPESCLVSAAEDRRFELLRGCPNTLSKCAPRRSGPSGAVRDLDDRNWRGSAAARELRRMRLRMRLRLKREE